MNKLSQKFDFIEVEKKLQAYWQEIKVYNWSEGEPKENSYIIDTPPPTVSGNLHIGHIFSYNHTDFIARYNRMKGKNVFYPMGFDDNGLPTERLVEKQKSIRARDLPRDEFIKICREVIKIEEKNFKELFITVGLSVDWNYQYQSISDKSMHISQMSFIDLLQKGQIYRSFEPALWDPVDQTSISQAEIEEVEHESCMYDIKFSTEFGEIIIATTRPELLPACVSVFFHPHDKRYQNYEKLEAITPLFKVKVPLIADEKVDMQKGTGLVMCCTFGDNVDVAWWRQHKLDSKIIIDKFGKITTIDFTNISLNAKDAAMYMEKLCGLKIKAARIKMIEILKEQQLIVKEVAIKHNVKCAERSGAPLEIILAPQWFIRSIEHKDKLLERSGELNWYPKGMKIKLDTWIKNISWDWCISRQRYFGVPFPVWYSKRAGEEGKVLVASLDQLPLDPATSTPNGYMPDEVEPDIDVMDTWATSAVSPQLSASGISDNMSIDAKRYMELFPSDLRPQAHEILRTWAFGTILKSQLHANKLPWKNIMISGWCLASDKSKMSKSKGNSIITPNDLLIKHGADVIRYWSANARLGSDTVFSEEVISSGRRFVNKLWNASRFIELHFDQLGNKRFQSIDKVTHSSDKIILSLITKVIEKTTSYFEDYEYCQAREVVESFFWQDFCDNYLEIIKVRIYNENLTDDLGQESAIITLNYCLSVILKLCAPFMPYVTEEIYSKLYSEDKSIHKRFSWPTPNFKLLNDKLSSEWGVILQILDLTRKAKSSRSLSIKSPILKMELLTSGDFLSQDLLQDLKNVMNINEIYLVEKFSSGIELLTASDYTIGLVF